VSGAVTVAVIAKAPVPGRVKTRLCPPCTAEQAAALAEASLRDTLAAMATVAREADAVDGGLRVRRAIVLDGAPGAWLDGETVVPQRGGGLAERLAGAFDDLGGPALIVGMDTPQLTPAHLRHALAALREHDAVLGPASDGGYWGIGLRTPDARALHGVPMSVDHTLAAQRARLAALGLCCADADELLDVDTIEDAAAVASLAPDTRFARAFAALPPAVGA
jgi:rSAM/selenodomain-associated transferase 1